MLVLLFSRMRVVATRERLRLTRLQNKLSRARTTLAYLACVLAGLIAKDHLHPHGLEANCAEVQHFCAF